MSSVVLPSLQLPEPLALAATRLMTQTLAPVKVELGIGSGGPNRQPLIEPVQVPPVQSALARHGHLSPLPQLTMPCVPPTQALYSGLVTPADVQVRFVTPVSVPLVGAMVKLVPEQAVVLVNELPMSGTTLGSGRVSPLPPV